MRTAEIAITDRYIAEPQSAPDERRAHPRETLFAAALLVLADGSTQLCTMVDRSLGGFRLKLQADHQLPDHFQLIDLLSGLGYEGQTVWRAEALAGARRLATYDLRAEQDGVGERLQAAWKAALA